MRAPDFWWRDTASPIATALAPLGALYGGITARRMTRPGQQAGVPVLCVGNLVAGGAGKTPAAIAIARMLQRQGLRPAILSRGYGRVAHRPDDVLAVDPARHHAIDCGDEPLLLARAAPTLVSADRVRAAAAAVAAGAQCLILDDGLQNPALAKDWTLAVADGAAGVGNGLCVPAGPLRAPVDRQWPAVAMLAVIGDGEPGDRLATAADRAGVPVVGARLVPDGETIARWRGRRLFAFAGIGRPAKFFATLAAAALDVVGTRSFPDHYAFRPSDLHELEAAAAARNALLVTTAKDRVRLPSAAVVDVLPVELVFDQPDRVLASMRLRT